MAGSSFALDIVSPERVLTRVPDCVSLVVPAAEGYLGVLAGHAPLVAQLVPGEIKYRRATGVEEQMATSGGFLEVTPDKVTVLVDTAEKPDEIDVDRAQAALRRARERLTTLPSGTDIDRARTALARAAARLAVTGHLHR